MKKSCLFSLFLVMILISVTTSPVLALDYNETEKNLAVNRLFCKLSVDTDSRILTGSDSFQTLSLSGDANYNSPTDYGVLHKYLGYTTLLIAGVAAVSSSQKSVHYGASYAATGAAIGTCATGFAEYGERYDLEEGFLASDNLHINLGVVGTIAFATAVAIADNGKESSHAGLGVTGGAAMLMSVVVIKW